MKQKATLIPLVFALALHMQGKAQIEGRVIKVVDGDTYHVSMNGRIKIVRLANVDAPEMKQAFGFTAQQKASEALIGKLVLVDSTGTNRYKRTIANIRVEGKAVDSLLVTNGWAWVYLEYCNDANLIALQNAAISANKGLWKCGARKVCPPWLYRHYNASSKAKYCKGCKP